MNAEAMLDGFGEHQRALGLAGSTVKWQRKLLLLFCHLLIT